MKALWNNLFLTSKILPKNEIKNYKNEVILEVFYKFLFFFPNVTRMAILTNKIYYESRSCSEVFPKSFYTMATY
jgi:hypothetical protein